MEWLEYHRLVGVQHFFIYDTSPSSSSSFSSSSSSSTSSSTVGTYPHIKPWDLNENKNSSNGRGVSSNSSNNSRSSSRSGSGSGRSEAGERKSPHPSHTHGLRTLLGDYLRLGLVTIIPWPHAECDKATYVRDNNSHSAQGASCPPIPGPSLRSVALSSCYLR